MCIPNISRGFRNTHHTLSLALSSLSLSKGKQFLFFFEIPSFDRFILACGKKKECLSNEQSLTGCWRWSSCFQTAQESKLRRKHTPRGAIQDQLGWSRTGKWLRSMCKMFLFFSFLPCFFFFSLLRGKRSTPLHQAVSWGHLSIGGSGGLMCIKLQSDPFHSICRNISESVYSLGKVLRSCHRWESKSSPGLELQLQLGPLIENILISHDWVRHISASWQMGLLTASHR